MNDRTFKSITKSVDKILKFETHRSFKVKTINMSFNYQQGDRLQIAKSGEMNAPLPQAKQFQAPLVPSTQSYSQYMSVQQSSSNNQGQNYNTNQGNQNSFQSNSNGYHQNGSSGFQKHQEFDSARTNPNSMIQSTQTSSQIIQGEEQFSQRLNGSSYGQQIGSSYELQGGSSYRQIGGSSYDQKGGSSQNFGSQSNQGNFKNMIEHPTVLVNQREGKPTIIETREGKGVVIDVIERESRIINETMTWGESKIVNEREIKRERPSQTREVKKENITTDVLKKNREVELIREVAIPVEKYIDVTYDVVIDVPIERTIEKEIITEVVVEKPIEKVVEVVIEQEIEIPVEKVVEVPVEIKRNVEVPFERIVNKPYEVIKENINYRQKIVDVNENEIHRYGNADQVLPTDVKYEYKNRVVEKPVYVDNIIEQPRVIERKVEIEVPRHIPVVKKYQVEIERPVPREKIIHQEYEVPVVNEIYVDKEFIIEKPVFRENIIEKPVEVKRFVEKEVIVPIEHIVEKPIYHENIIEKKFDKLIEVPAPFEQVTEVFKDNYTTSTVNIERVKERPVEKTLYQPNNKVNQVTIPFNIEVAKFVTKPVETIIEKRINRFFEQPTEKIIERPSYIERFIEKPKIVEKTIEIPVENVRENIRTVERVVDKPVYIDKEVIKNVEHIVIKDVHVPVERVVEVEVKIAVEKPVYKETLVEEEILTKSVYEDFDDNYEQLEVFEHEDEEVAADIQVREKELNSQIRENNNLKNDYMRLKQEL